MPIDSLFPRYGYVDPASGKKERELKKIKSRSAIAIVAQDYLSRIWVLDAWADRVPTEELIERMYGAHQKWKLKVLGGEANGMQSIFQDAIVRDARLRGRELPLVPVYQPTGIDKDTRIRHRLQALIARGGLILGEDMHNLKDEIRGFPLTPFKDLIDAVASAVALIPPMPTKREVHDEAQSLVDYLRKSGAPASYIEQVARSRGLNR